MVRFFDNRRLIATPPAREKSAGALERPYGPGQGLTRKEPFVRTETRCGFDGLDERKEQVPSSIEISLRLSSKIDGGSHG